MAEEKAEQMDAPEVLSDATAQAIVQAPVALLGARLTAQGGVGTFSEATSSWCSRW